MKFRQGKSRDNAVQWSSPLAQLGPAFFSLAGAPHAFLLACLLAGLSGHLHLPIVWRYLQSFSFPVLPPMGKYWVSVSFPLTRSVWRWLGGGCLQGCSGCLFPCARIVARLHQPLRHQLPSSSIVDEFKHCIPSFVSNVKNFRNKNLPWTHTVFWLVTRNRKRNHTRKLRWSTGSYNLHQ